MRFVPKPLVETADVSRGVQSRLTRLKNAVAVLLTGVGLYLVLGWFGTWLGGRLPDRWEVWLFRGLSTSVLSPTTKPQAIEPARRIFNRLIEGETLRELPYELRLVPLSGANAVALPGGLIGLTPALLEELETDEGLAFVLAHELGHHEHRDLPRALGRRLILAFFTRLAFGAGGLDPVESMAELGERGYSRRQERAADAFALELAARKFGPSTNLLEFLRRTATNEVESPGARWTGTHPLTRERLEQLEALLAGDASLPGSGSSPGQIGGRPAQRSR